MLWRQVHGILSQERNCHSFLSAMNGFLWKNIVSFIGIPTSFSSVLVRSVVWDGLKLLILGSVIETARRMFIWVVDRFRIRMFRLLRSSIVN